MTTTVLLVEPDADDRDRYGAWLEAEGYEIVLCPGPRSPRYRCIGDSTGSCALATGADVVVLDAEIDSEISYEGTTAGGLVQLYAALGKPVVVLSPSRGTWFEVGDVVVLPRPALREELLGALAPYAPSLPLVTLMSGGEEHE